MVCQLYRCEGVNHSCNLRSHSSEVVLRASSRLRAPSHPLGQLSTDPSEGRLEWNYPQTWPSPGWEVSLALEPLRNQGLFSGHETAPTCHSTLAFSFECVAMSKYLYLPAAWTFLGAASEGRSAETPDCTSLEMATGGRSSLHRRRMF